MINQNGSACSHIKKENRPDANLTKTSRPVN